MQRNKTDRLTLVIPAQAGIQRVGNGQRRASCLLGMFGSLMALSLVLVATASGNDEKGAKSSPVSAAVIRFQDRTDGSKGTADKVTELFSSELSNAAELMLVERDDMERILLKEQELNLSGAIKADDAIRIGRLTGARLIITGSVIDTGTDRYLVAKIVSTETSRVLGASAKGKLGDNLFDLVQKLSEDVISGIREKGSTVLPSPEGRDDLLARLKKQLDEQARPTVMVKVTESHTGVPKVDPAAQTELTSLCKELGFKVIDPAVGNESDAEFLILGEGLSEFAGRRGSLVSVRGRLEVKVVHRKSGEVVAADSQMVRVVDATEVIAGKEALQQAATAISERILPKIRAGAAGDKKKKK